MFWWSKKLSFLKECPGRFGAYFSAFLAIGPPKAILVSKVDEMATKSRPKSDKVGQKATKVGPKATKIGQRTSKRRSKSAQRAPKSTKVEQEGV